MAIGERRVGPGHPPFIVAELSGNHNGSLDRALAIVDAAAAAGAHAIKLQTYKANTITLDIDAPGFRIDEPASPWSGRTLHSLYDEAHTPREWHPALFERARELGLEAFSTPFDESAVDFLETLDASCYKIASFEIVHLPLIRRVAATGRPLIMSTGMASLDELTEAVETARSTGCKDLILLKCTSAYPADPADADLLTIPDLRKRFACLVGLSDHTTDPAVAVAAVALGATVIERHCTLSRADRGVDSAFSTEPQELAALVKQIRRASTALGRVSYGPKASERASLRLRPSLFIAQDMCAGEVLTTENLRVARPALGLAPRHYDDFLGRRVARDAITGTPVDWNLVE